MVGFKFQFVCFAKYILYTQIKVALYKKNTHHTSLYYKCASVYRM